MKKIKKITLLIMYLVLPEVHCSHKYSIYENNLLLRFLKVSLWITAAMLFVKLLSLIMS